MSIKWIDSDTANHSKAFRKVNASTPLNIDDLLQLIDYEETYEGSWLAHEQQGSLLKSAEGIFEMRLVRLIETRNNSYFELYLRVFDGVYADDGIL